LCKVSLAFNQDYQRNWQNPQIVWSRKRRSRTGLNTVVKYSQWWLCPRYCSMFCLSNSWVLCIKYSCAANNVQPGTFQVHFLYPFVNFVHSFTTEGCPSPTAGVTRSTLSTVEEHTLSAPRSEKRRIASMEAVTMDTHISHNEQNNKSSQVKFNP
jgi:hypothetical protein